MKLILSLRIPESISGKPRGPQTIFWESLMCVNVLWKLETPYKGVLITLKIYTLEIRKGLLGTFLRVWWLRIHLPKQGMWVWSLVRNYDPMCHRATKPTHHNHWACSPHLESLRAPTRIPQAETKTCHRHKYMHAAAKSLQSCPTLCDPRDGSPPGPPVPGILQARTLEWVAISFSNSWKWKVKVKSLSHVQLLATPWTAAHQAPLPWDFPGKSTGVGCHCLLWNTCIHT